MLLKVMLPKISLAPALALLVAVPQAHADRPEPVPLYGSYDTFLDHSRQTFNGRPDTSDPSTQAALFRTRVRRRRLCCALAESD